MEQILCHSILQKVTLQSSITQTYTFNASDQGTGVKNVTALGSLSGYTITQPTKGSGIGLIA